MDWLCPKKKRHYNCLSINGKHYFFKKFIVLMSIVFNFAISREEHELRRNNIGLV